MLSREDGVSGNKAFVEFHTTAMLALLGLIWGRCWEHMMCVPNTYIHVQFLGGTPFLVV